MVGGSPRATLNDKQLDPIDYYRGVIDSNREKRMANRPVTPDPHFTELFIGIARDNAIQYLCATHGAAIKYDGLIRQEQIRDVFRRKTPNATELEVNNYISRLWSNPEVFEPDIYTKRGGNDKLFVEFDEGADFHSNFRNDNYVKKYLTYNNILVYHPNSVCVRITYPNGMREGPNTGMNGNFNGTLDITAKTVINFAMKNYNMCANCYILAKWFKRRDCIYKYVTPDQINNAITYDSMTLFEYYGQQFSIDQNYDAVLGGKVMKQNDNFLRFKDMDTMSNREKSAQPIPWDEEEVAKKMGFFTIDGIGNGYKDVVDMLNPNYDDDTRFTKALDFYVSGMSNCYANCVHGEETSIFHILSKMAPKATNLYNYDYGVNIADLYCEDVEKIEEMGGIDNLDELVKIKREYVEKVFGDSTFNEYDKRFAVNVVLSEFVMWSEYYEDYIKRTVSPYFVKFFEEHKEYIAENSIDWKEWNEKHVPNKSRWMDE